MLELLFEPHLQILMDSDMDLTRCSESEVLYFFFSFSAIYLSMIHPVAA